METLHHYYYYFFEPPVPGEKYQKLKKKKTAASIQQWKTLWKKTKGGYYYYYLLITIIIICFWYHRLISKLLYKLAFVHCYCSTPPITPQVQGGVLNKFTHSLNRTMTGHWPARRLTSAVADASTSVSSAGSRAPCIARCCLEPVQVLTGPGRRGHPTDCQCRCRPLSTWTIAHAAMADTQWY